MLKNWQDYSKFSGIKLYVIIEIFYKRSLVSNTYQNRVKFIRF